jgi:hypothetical protein
MSCVHGRHFLHCRYSDHSKQKPPVATTVCQLPAAVSPHVSLIIERACEPTTISRSWLSKAALRFFCANREQAQPSPIS